MPTAHQTIVEVPVTTHGVGSSDTAAHQRAFPGSPFHSGELTDDGVKEQFVELAIDGETNDEGHTFGVFNRDYVDAPNLEEVETGGGGLPGTPYTPNIAVPESGMNPADIPESGVEATEAVKGSGGPFPGDGLVSPHESSARVARQTLGSLILGRSSTEA